MTQPKARILRRFPKIGGKVIEYAYVSGQCRQIIPRYIDHVYIFVFVNIEIKTLELFIVLSKIDKKRCKQTLASSP